MALSIKVNMMQKKSLILVFIAGVTLALLFFIYRLTGNIDEGDQHRRDTVANLKIMGEALEEFNLDFKRYPNTEEVPGVLVRENSKDHKLGYLDGWPKDGWSHSFVYKRVPDASHPFYLYSAGPNGIDENGEGDDVDYWKVKTEH